MARIQRFEAHILRAVVPGSLRTIVWALSISWALDRPSPPIITFPSRITVGSGVFLFRRSSKAGAGNLLHVCTFSTGLDESEYLPTMISGRPLGTYITCSFGVLPLTLTLDDVTGSGFVGVVGVVAGVCRGADEERRGLPRSGLDTKAPVAVEPRLWTWT